MAEILVDVERVSARRPDRPLFESLSLTVSTGDRLGVVGVNGTGKSTLLRVLAGAAEPESGVVRRGRGVRVGFLDQQPTLPAGSVRSAVGSGWEAAEILERLGMGGLTDADVATLSGGQAKRVALARVLVSEVDLLILDEPTNHLDIDAVAWLEARLASFRGGLVLVTHDRHVLDRVTTRMLELDRGRAYIHDGGYASYLDARAVRVEREAGAEAVRRNLARAELAWLRRGAPARTRKPKARIAAAKAIVEGGPAPAGGPIDLGPGGPTGWTGGGSAAKPTPTPRLGDKVITLHGGGHHFGGDPTPWLFRNLDVDLEPGGRLAVVGPNGSGKTTLLDILAGRLTPTEGRVERAGTVVLSYYDQTGRDLDPNQRVREVVAGKAAQPGWEQVRLMERFRFDSDLQWATIGTLSGGERRRLQLLLALTSFPNVLLLDEPTNDLDLDTLRALEDFLETWPGSLVIVSHDRALLERTAEEALVLDGHGGAAHAPGGYAQYEAARRRRAETPAPRPAPTRATPSVGNAAPASTRAAPSVGKAPASPPTGPAAKKPRSPSTLRRLIGLAEAEMEKAAAERDGLLADLAAAGNDHVALARIAETLAAAEARLSAAEERWLELSEELGA